MRFMLLVGMAFWSTVAFVGVRKTFEQGENAFTEKMRALNQSHRGLLLMAGIVGLLSGFTLEVVEIIRIGRMAGTIGGFASLGFISAIVGAVCLSAHLALSNESRQPQI